MPSKKRNNRNTNGPGRADREGVSLIKLTKMFPDDPSAEAWFAMKRWGDNPVCPHCASKNVQSGAKHPSMPYRCRSCRKRFSVRIGTVMQDSKLGYQVWALAIYIMTTSIKGVSSMKLHRDLSITQTTAWHLAHRIRQSWNGEHALFAGPVEVAEAYFGGKEKNKHASKKLKAGRGPVGKKAVVGVRDRVTNSISAEVVENIDGQTLNAFVDTHVSEDTEVYTDGTSAYRGRNNHAYVRHSVGEYVREQVHTNGVESFWSLLKRGYYGTYHHMSKKHLQRYVNEFAGRHNARDYDTAEPMTIIAQGLVGKRLMYKSLIS